MKIETVYTNDGKHLGDEYINLSKLQQDTKLAIVHMIYLDEYLRVSAGCINKDLGTGRVSDE